MWGEAGFFHLVALMFWVFSALFAIPEERHMEEQFGEPIQRLHPTIASITLAGEAGVWGYAQPGTRPRSVLVKQGCGI